MISRLSITTAVAMGKSATSVFRGEGIPDETAEKIKNGHHSVQMYKNAEVCLTCTKSECSGGETCFRERKKKLNNGGP